MNIKDFDLNIEKVLENWSISDAIREIIANALDEMILTSTSDIQIFSSNDGWHIRDFGRGLQYKHLTQNENEEKLNADNLIGKFGVGLKDALATFDRHNVQVTILSKYGKITLDKSPKYGFEDIITLHANIEKSTDGNFIGTEFILKGCTKKDIEDAKQLFLYFLKPELLENTIIGDVYVRQENMANIYINGVLVAQEPNFLFSYNITSLTKKIKNAINRERTNVGRTAYSDRVKDILLKCGSKKIITLLTDNLNSMSDGDTRDELMWVDVASHSAKLLSSFEDVVYMTPRDFEELDAEKRDILNTSGKKCIFVSDRVFANVANTVNFNGDFIGTMNTVIEEYRNSYEYKFIPYKLLTKQEQNVFDTSNWAIDFYDAKLYKNKIVVSETIRPDGTGHKALGVWDANMQKIVILREQLSATDKFLGTLIHELVHAKKHLVDVDRDFENELTNIIGSLATKCFEQNNQLDTNKGTRERLHNNLKNSLSNLFGK
jgi:hypothetical protein